MRRWITLGVLLVVSQALLADSCGAPTAPAATGNAVASIGSVSTPTPAPAVTAPPALVTYTTSGSKQTTTFSTAGAFTLSWTATASAGCSNLIVTVSVYATGKNPNSDAADGGPFEQTGCSAYTTEVNVSAGAYFLSLDVANGTAVFTVKPH